MKLLLNDKEIAHFLLSLIDYKSKVENQIILTNFETREAINWFNEKRYGKPGRKFDFSKWRDKLKKKVIAAVESDLSTYYKGLQELIELEKTKHYELVHGNIEYFISTLGEEKILELYKLNQKQNFVKSVGFKLDESSTMMRRKKFVEYKDDCLIRNTVGNEKLLISKIDNRYPFWFIDSGYTNFLEMRKTWHRIARNHIHNGDLFDAPVDRLHIFKKFPAQWRSSGDKILVVEPGPFAAGIFHVDLKTWKYDIERELRNYTDKKIVFREKAPKKERTNLYQHFLDEDYYCVISINSNAATEAIWAGIPAITLDKHISNSVTRNKLSDINDLLRPNLANWLCMLSYSQFTYDELVDGTAVEIFRKFQCKK